MDFTLPEISLAIIAEYSKPVAITVILGCMISMAIFILRLNINGKVEIRPGEIIPGQAMRGVHNPYNFQLSHKYKASLKDGVTLQLNCSASCVVQALWGVSIAELYPNMYLPWRHFVDDFIRGTWMKDHVIYRGEKLRLPALQSQKVKLELPSEVEVDLGELPRKKYPLVVVLINDDSLADDLQNICVVSHISIFHLQDEQCPGSSHIISQYIRTPAGYPYQLQPLYIASTEEDNATTQNHSTQSTDQPGSSGTANNDSDIDFENTGGKCVVCQTEKINRALLPCRHACVCDSCFIHLAKCPMCRSPIVSYFQLNPTEDNPWPDDKDEEIDLAELPWWERWNHRINAFFGLA